LIHSVFYSSLQTARFIGIWALNIPFILLSILVIAFADRIKIKTDYRVIFSFLLFAVFAGSFLPYFATGVLGQHRTINFIFFFFILLWLLFLLSISKKFLLPEKLKRLAEGKIIYALICMSALIMIFTGNGLKIIGDFRKENFRKYETIFYDRQKEILEHPDAPIKKLSLIPSIFQVVDVKADTTWWVDKCMRKYYLRGGKD